MNDSIYLNVIRSSGTTCLLVGIYYKVLNSQEKSWDERKAKPTCRSTSFFYQLKHKSESLVIFKLDGDGLKYVNNVKQLVFRFINRWRDGNGKGPSSTVYVVFCRIKCKNSLTLEDMIPGIVLDLVSPPLIRV